MLLPNLKGLSLPARVTPVAVNVPQIAIDVQVAAGRFLANAPGIIISAGRSKKESLRRMLQIFPGWNTWSSGGWLYAYSVTGTSVNAEVVLELQTRNLAFTILGGAEVKPNEFVIALVNKYWYLSGRQGNGSVLDWFYHDDDGTLAEAFFKKIYEDRTRMPGWKYFATFEDVMQDVRSGEDLPIAWWDDGMLFLEEFLEETRAGGGRP